MKHNNPIGSNQLELLLFTLGDSQLYGINVYKVREIMKLPTIHEIPKSDPRIVGIADYRDVPTTIIDLNKGLDKSVPLEIGEDTHVVYTQFNNKTQAFLVDKVEKIVRLDWDKVFPPPMAESTECYLTSITKIDNTLVEIIDVEKIIEDVTGSGIESRIAKNKSNISSDLSSKMRVLVVDDSAMARNKTVNVLEAMGLRAETCINGYEALSMLKNVSKEEDVCRRRVEDVYLMVITDIEMPQLDGLAFIEEVRRDPDLKNLHMVIQSSIDGGFRSSSRSAAKVDGEIIKWNEERLVEIIQKRIDEL